MSINLNISSISEKRLIHLTDEELVSRCKTELPHLTSAFEVLLYRYQPIVLITCYKLIGNNQDAEEVCQDVFVRVFHHIKNFKERSSFKTWLYRIVHNASISKAMGRSKYEKKAVGLSEVNENQIIGKRTSNNDKSGTGFEDLQIYLALELLSEEDRRIMLLRFISGLSIKEISDVIGIEINAVKVRLFRAKNRFRSAYGRTTCSQNGKF
ncbi:hypothetical protein BVX98_07365 [bacterium F11]|nr:hypothetical protein BVX98_07365 [bacterium F11]